MLLDHSLPLFLAGVRLFLLFTRLYATPAISDGAGWGKLNFCLIQDNLDPPPLYFPHNPLSPVYRPWRACNPSPLLLSPSGSARVLLHLLTRPLVFRLPRAQIFPCPHPQYIIPLCLQQVHLLLRRPMSREPGYCFLQRSNLLLECRI